MIFRSKLTVLSAVLSAVLATSASAAFADPFWDAYHGRRDEIIDRLQKQDRRIDEKVAAGLMPFERARRLHEEDHRIFAEEQDMVRVDGGRLTRVDSEALNQQLNRVSEQIGG